MPGPGFDCALAAAAAHALFLIYWEQMQIVFSRRSAAYLPQLIEESAGFRKGGFGSRTAFA
jgi:hypothetical protein